MGGFLGLEWGMDLDVLDVYRDLFTEDINRLRQQRDGLKRRQSQLIRTNRQFTLQIVLLTSDEVIQQRAVQKELNEELSRSNQLFDQLNANLALRYKEASEAYATHDYVRYESLVVDDFTELRRNFVDLVKCMATIEQYITQIGNIHLPVAARYPDHARFIREKFI